MNETPGFNFILNLIRTESLD